MALPLLLGLGGSALAPTLGIGALTAGAVGSGLGSLLQGDDLGTAIGTGMLSYFGGKMLGPKLASAGVGSTPVDTVGAAVSPSFVGPPVAPVSPGIPGAIQSATQPDALAALGSGLLANEAIKPPEIDFKTEEYPDIPEAEPARRKRNPILPGYRPGIDPEMPYFFAEGGEVSKPNDKEIINNAVNAIKGTSPEPERALAMFVSSYGEEALRDLVGRVRSGEFDDNAQTTEGMIEGVGDGMDDMIPATLEGEQDVVLSDGEFIVPADVVSGLGNGSTDAGAKSLYEMMDRVREMRTGMTEQPDQVPQGMMLPA